MSITADSTYDMSGPLGFGERGQLSLVELRANLLGFREF